MSTTSNFSLPLASILLNPDLSLETKQAITELLLEEIEKEIEELLPQRQNG